MRAVILRGTGGGEVLALRHDEPTPEPGHGQVRVRVRATAVNRADVLQRKGMYPAPADAPAHILGLEYAGEIDALGPGVNEARVGERVFGLVGGGSYAEYVLVPERALARMPDGLSFEEAAAMPEAYLTAYDAMVTQGGLGAGGTVLVHAVGSGVGTASVQIACAIGARVVGTARSEVKLEQAKKLGMHAGVVARDARFADAVLAATAGVGVDVVLELVGGAYVAEDLKVVRSGGRVVVVGLLDGRSVELDLGLLLRKRVTLRGTVLRSRPLEEKIAVHRVLQEALVPLMASGALRPVTAEVMPLADAARAHELMESNTSFGKIVLLVE